MKSRIWIPFYFLSGLFLTKRDNFKTVAAFTTEATFNGSQYIRYDIKEATNKDRIVLNFKTSEPSGMLLYGCGTQGDFIALEIKRGKVR